MGSNGSHSSWFVVVVLTHEAYQCLSNLERKQQEERRLLGLGGDDEGEAPAASDDEPPLQYDFEVMRREQLDWRQEPIQH